MEVNASTHSTLNFEERTSVGEDDGQPTGRENLQSWNKPRRNAFRVFAVYYSFFVFGLNDGAYGSLLPYLESHYGLSDTEVSLIFLSPLFGYTVAALLSSILHTRFGQRGISILATCSHIVAYGVISAHPPYPTIIVMYALAGFGYGLIDGGWNAWTGSLKDANAIQGLLSSCYSIGATISPIVATSMSQKQGWGWYTFYWFMVSVTSLSRSFAHPDQTKHLLMTCERLRLAVPPYPSSSFLSHFGIETAVPINPRLKTDRGARRAV